jgi:hypothetical protein
MTTTDLAIPIDGAVARALTPLADADDDADETTLGRIAVACAPEERAGDS